MVTWLGSACRRWVIQSKTKKQQYETRLRYTYGAEILQRRFQTFELSRQRVVALSYQDDAIKTTKKQKNTWVTHLYINQKKYLANKLSRKARRLPDTHFWFLRSVVHSVGWTLDRETDCRVSNIKKHNKDISLWLTRLSSLLKPVLMIRWSQRVEHCRIFDTNTQIRFLWTCFCSHHVGGSWKTKKKISANERDFMWRLCTFSLMTNSRSDDSHELSERKWK